MKLKKKQLWNREKMKKIRKRLQRSNSEKIVPMSMAAWFNRRTVERNERRYKKKRKAALWPGQLKAGKKAVNDREDE